MSNQEGSRGQQTSDDVGDDTIRFLLAFKEKGRDLCNPRPPSIYMVPSLLRDVSPSSFKPKVVSIGPLHKEDPILQKFEDEKATYLHYLLDRLEPTPEQALEACLQKVNASIHEIRACYDGIRSYTDVELAKMMVIDASFILEFLTPSSVHRPIIYRNLPLVQSIAMDLLSFENQIPFFVLHDIFECTLMNSLQSSLTSIILEEFERINPFPVFRNDVVDAAPDHILGLLQKSLHPEHIMLSSDEMSRKSKHSALELHNAGVKFKPHNGEKWQLAMEFRLSWFASFSWWSWSNPTLTMPVLYIDDGTEQFLRNIIAYEQCTPPDVPKYVSSYLCALDTLVNTPEDLEKLVESKVIISILGSNEDATDLINNISKGVVLVDFYYKDEWKQLDMYYNGYWPRNIAWLKRTYFSNPWTIIALLAGFILFGLTVVQTIFAIKTT